MDPRLNAILDLEPTSVEELLDRLCALHARNRTDESVRVPLVTLYLRSGREFSGCVLRMSTGQRGGAALLFHLPGHEVRGPKLDLAYVPVSAVEAVVVHDGWVLAPRPAAPSRLDLKRRLAALADGTAALVGRRVSFVVEWPDVPETEDAHRTLGALLQEVEAALRAIAGDAMGLSALKEKLMTVSLAIGPEAHSQMAGGEFRVRAPSTGGVTREVLTTALEAGL